jgi:glycerate kinase
LTELHTVDSTGLDSRLKLTRFRVLSDVTNPLLGAQGAARVFAPQKGADPRAVVLLELGLSKLQQATLSDSAAQPGAGAGGGLGFAALEFLGAQMQSGAREVMALTGFADKLAGANLVITGEGSFDAQSLAGKVPQEVVVAAREKDIPVLVVCGTAGETTSAELEDLGLIHIMRLTDLEPDIDRCIREAEELLFRVGMQIPNALNF